MLTVGNPKTAKGESLDYLTGIHLVDRKLCAAELRAVLDAGHTLQAPCKRGVLFAVVRREGDRYVMRGLTGRHSLAVSCTNSARLYAHWQGFKEIAASLA